MARYEKLTIFANSQDPTDKDPNLPEVMAKCDSGDKIGVSRNMVAPTPLSGRITAARGFFS